MVVTIMCQLFEKCIIILIFYFYSSGVHAVSSADKLDFWEPDSKFNIRRSNNHQHQNVNNIPYFRTNEETTNRKSIGDKNNLKDNLKAKLRAKHQRAIVRSSNQEVYRPRNISRDHGSVRKDRKNNRVTALQYGNNSVMEDKLSKDVPQKYLRNRKTRPVLRSTRITPMYLMQQSPEHKTTSKPKDGVAQLDKLSSYFIAKQMNYIMADFLNANYTIEIVGRTAAYNDIVLVKVTEKIHDEETLFRANENKYIDEMPEKKIIFIVHGLSIIGMKTLDCLSNVEGFSMLVSYYLDHLDKFDIFLIPLANPDGYASNVHFLNKNRSPQAACPGVYLDRNFDVAWNTSKVVSSCSPIYGGASPFSEPETRAVRDVFHHYSHKIIAYIHVHAGSFESTTYKGEAILYPKGYSDVQTDDDKYLDLRGEVEESMKNASFQMTSVTVDTLYNWYGKVSGSSVDYASTVYGIPYAMEFVMQPYPASSFKTISLKEIWKRMVDVIFNNFLKSVTVNEIK